MRHEYPCIFGAVSLSESSLLLDNINNEKKVFVDSKKRLIIYQYGESDNIHIYKSRNQVLIVLGRIYSPVFLAPGVMNRDASLSEIANLDLSSIEGNYLSIYFSCDESENINFRLSTDKYGSKMILYYKKNNLLYFSTHLSGLKYLMKDMLPNISRNSLLHYYYFGQTANDRTLFEGINKVPPASSLTFYKSDFAVERYFSLGELYNAKKYLNISENEICNELNTLITDSILIRNPSKELLGLTLSGGVDSGLVAKRLIENGIDIIGYNLAYKDYYNEDDRLDRLRRILDVNIKKVNVSVEQIIENIKFTNRISSEPVGLNDSALQLLAVEARKDGINTLWEGGGADHLFFGMNRYLKYKKVNDIYNILLKIGLAASFRFMTRLIKHREFKKLYHILNNWQRGIPPYPKRKYGKSSNYNEINERNIFNLAIRKYWENFSEEFDSKDLRLYFTYQTINMDPEEHFYPPSEQQLYLDLFPISPYWNDKIVSLALSIPMSLKTKRGKTKYILRKTATINSNYKYWMLPKIGLHNALHFILNSPEGEEWRQKQHRKIVNTEIYHKLYFLLNKEEEIDLDRLIPLIIWSEANNINECA